MTYLEWNNAIIKHYFKPENEEKEVMLYFSEAIIEEIGNNNFTCPDDGYINDFYKALSLGVAGISNENYINRILTLEQKYRNGCRGIAAVNFEYPPYLSYILAFILPFTSGNKNEEFNMSNFHGYVKDFFEKKQLTKNYDKIIKNHLTAIDDLWTRINEWLMNEMNFSIGFLEEINPKSNKKFVGKFEYHILFRKEQEDRLSQVFDENEILPGEAINEKVMRKLLVEKYQYLKLSLTTKNKIADVDDYIGGKILKRALTFYNNWEGTNFTVEGVRGFSRNRLVLCLDFNGITPIKLKYVRIFSKNGIPENLKLEKRDGVVLVEEIHQINSFYSNPIENCFIDLNTDIQLVDSSARNKYTWKSKDIYIFKKISHLDWVEIPKVEYNVGKTLIICKKIFFEENLKHWFENISNNKKLFDNNTQTQLPNDLLSFTIESVTNCPHPTIQELIPELEQKPKINFDKSFYIDGQLFKDKLPTVWLENTELIDKVIAQYEDGSEIRLNHLTQDEEGVVSFINQFTFTDEHKSSNKLNQQFKLVCNNISSHRFLQITDFNKKNNTEIETLLSKRDAIGQLTSSDENYFKGIEHFFSQNKIAATIPFQNQLNNLFINHQNNENYRQNSQYNSQQLGNILIHYISTKGQLSKREFNDVVFLLLENGENTQENIKKIAIRLSYLLQELGYVEYDSDKSTFYINKPHLLVVPSENGTKFNLIGARDTNMISAIINYCKKNTFLTIEIQTNNSNTLLLPQTLLPQTINLHMRKCDQKLIHALVDTFEIIFKKGNLFSQFALTSCFPDISNWRSYINEPLESEIQDIEGGYLFDIESLKFINKPIGFERDLAFIKYTNINGYKTIYRMWYSGTCYNIPDHQLGIYLYLYLYKKIRLENYDQCINTRGWVNCGKELEEKDHSQLKTNILVFDSERCLLAVPLSCRLPRYFSISFQLLSDHLPLIKKLEFDGVRYKDAYYIYQNIPKLFFENNLNHKLLKRAPQYPIFNRQIIL